MKSPKATALSNTDSLAITLPFDVPPEFRVISSIVEIDQWADAALREFESRLGNVSDADFWETADPARLDDDSPEFDARYRAFSRRFDEHVHETFAREARDEIRTILRKMARVVLGVPSDDSDETVPD